eukprot:SM000011S18973  [mRNA]  locus=s11:131159:132188:- [translate_table: standard]
MRRAGGQPKLAPKLRMWSLATSTAPSRLSSGCTFLAVASRRLVNPFLSLDASPGVCSLAAAEPLPARRSDRGPRETAPLLPARTPAAMNASYGYPAQGYGQGYPPKYPPAGYPQQGPQYYPQGPYGAQPVYGARPQKRNGGFLTGCLAALCCCCLVDDCCCDPTIIC